MEESGKLMFDYNRRTQQSNVSILQLVNVQQEHIAIRNQINIAIWLDEKSAQ